MLDGDDLWLRGAMLFPFDGGGGLGGDIEEDAIDALHRGNNALGDVGKKIPR